MLLERGSACSFQGDHVKQLYPGEALICDYAFAGTYNFMSDSESWCLKIPRGKLTGLIPGSTSFTGAMLDRNESARQLLFAYLRAGFKVDLCGSAASAKLYEDHIMDLIALALGAEGEARVVAENRGARAARRAAVLREIANRSGDPALSAVTIALLLGITPRYVHLLLEETGKSFTHHVLERRLERAAALLRDPRCRYQKIAELAAEAGFTDLSYFNRAFRRRFGATPTDVRQNADRGG